jgi:hypothetical protein
MTGMASSFLIHKMTSVDKGGNGKKQRSNHLLLQVELHRFEDLGGLLLPHPHVKFVMRKGQVGIDHRKKSASLCA